MRAFARGETNKGFVVHVPDEVDLRAIRKRLALTRVKKRISMLRAATVRDRRIVSPTSGLGYSRWIRDVRRRSGLHPASDIPRSRRHFAFGPNPDMRVFRHLAFVCGYNVRVHRHDDFA